MKNKFILFFLCLFFTGCWNYRELNDFAIITGAGIDYKDDKYVLSLMVANGKSYNSSSKEGSSQTTLLTGSGDSITEAIKDIESKSARDVYLGHLGVLIINENVSAYEVIDAFFRNPESINKYYIVVANNCESKDVLRVLSPLESFPSQNVILNIKNSNESIGYVPDIIFSEFLYNIVNPGLDGYLPSITISGKVKDADNIDDLNNSLVKASLKLSNIAIFKDYKLVDYASIKESRGINIVNNKISSLIINNSCNKNKSIITKLDNINSNIKIIGDNEILINIKTDGSINETNCNINLNDINTIKRINNMNKSKVYDIVDSAFKKSIELDSDIFGIGNMFYKKNRKFKLSNLKYNIKVDVNIKTKGSLETTIEEVQNEKN